MSSQRMVNEHDIFRHSLVVTMAVSALLLLWRGSAGLGLFFGGMLGSLIFRILALDITRMLRYPNQDMHRRARRGYFKRFLFYAATIAVSIVNDSISYSATIVGLLIPRLVILFFTLVKGGKHAT